MSWPNIFPVTETQNLAVYMLVIVIRRMATLADRYFVSLKHHLFPPESMKLAAGALTFCWAMKGGRTLRATTAISSRHRHTFEVAKSSVISSLTSSPLSLGGAPEGCSRRRPLVHVVVRGVADNVKAP